MGLRIERVWSMPHKWTFLVKPIKDLLDKEMDGGDWLDPFAGQHSPANFRNDISPEANADYHMDALDFLKSMEGRRFDGILWDPPYTFKMTYRRYDGKPHKYYKCTGSYWSYLAKCKDALAILVRGGGKAICCGWSSGGLGLKRGFELEHILLVPHGSFHYDTIVTVETKVQEMLI